MLTCPNFANRSSACRSKEVYTRALTLLFFAASAFDLLQASSEHSGYTSLLNTIHLSSGDTETPLASVGVFCNRLLVGAVRVHGPNLG